MASPNSSESNPCPCGSNKTYPECCGSYINGKENAPTAEALMRSRYTAYTQHNNDYLLSTWHPDTRPSINPGDDDGTTWTGLDIIRTEAGLKNDKKGIVEFIASCMFKGEASHIHETSEFIFEDNRWYYVDGKGQQPIKRETPKVGRNDPCPCGSGKKFKKCCGR